MRKIILASHGKLATGMRDSVAMFGGKNIEVIEQTLEDTDFERRAEELLEKCRGDECIVFTDIIGGSVNQAFTKLLSKFSFYLVTGMDLGMVLDCVFTHKEINGEFMRRMVSESQKQICYMNDLVSQIQTDPEEV